MENSVKCVDYVKEFDKVLAYFATEPWYEMDMMLGRCIKEFAKDNLPADANAWQELNKMIGLILEGIYDLSGSLRDSSIRIIGLELFRRFLLAFADDIERDQIKELSNLASLRNI